MKTTFTLEELNLAFDIAEKETAAWFGGHTCSMTNNSGQDECPICFFRRRTKIRLGADEVGIWPSEHNKDNPPGKPEETVT